MWVRGHSRSLKVVPFEILGTVSYSPSIVTMVVSLAISEIFSVKEWPDLKIWVCDRSLSLSYIFILWGGTRSLRMPTLRPASQAGPMRNPSKKTSVVLRDTIRLP